ncbi:IS110 family transposase, partial [Salmonella enterica]|nr:IS110 family transposase [Salmonella enterica]
MNVRKLRENRKQQLLQQIAQQRQILSVLKIDWLRLTAPVDRGWQSLYQWRAFIVPGIGIAVFCAIKSKPRRLIIWPHRAVRNVLTRRITMNIVFLGIDLAKNVFQLCGVNQAGKPVYTKRTGRKELLQTLANIPACLIGIEASTGAFYWQREFEKLGHKVKIISPQYVKPFVRGQKNDGNDAQAIAVALMQPTMQFVPPKSPEQQDIQALHRARQRIVNHRTATVCQIRGLLLDRGIPIGSAVSRARRAIPLILEDAENGLSSRMRRTIAELYDLFNDLGRRIHFFDKEIETVFRQSEACQR